MKAQPANSTSARAGDTRWIWGRASGAYCGKTTSLIGLGRATEFTFSNLPISAQDALSWGMVNRLTSAEDLAATTAQIAMMLSMGPVGAFGETKKAFNRAILPNLEEVLEYEGELQEIAGKKEEHKIGVDAFLKKERPNFL